MGTGPLPRELAAEQLRASEEDTTVVLISDGKETCDADPCALVKELRDSGVRVQVHVVGFDVDQDEKDQRNSGDNHVEPGKRTQLIA